MIHCQAGNFDKVVGNVRSSSFKDVLLPESIVERQLDFLFLFANDELQKADAKGGAWEDLATVLQPLLTELVRMPVCDLEPEVRKHVVAMQTLIAPGEEVDDIMGTVAKIRKMPRFKRVS